MNEIKTKQVYFSDHISIRLSSDMFRWKTATTVSDSFSVCIWLVNVTD